MLGHPCPNVGHEDVIALLTLSEGVHFDSA